MFLWEMTRRGDPQGDDEIAGPAVNFKEETEHALDVPPSANTRTLPQAGFCSKNFKQNLCHVMYVRIRLPWKEKQMSPHFIKNNFRVHPLVSVTRAELFSASQKSPRFAVRLLYLVTSCVPSVSANGPISHCLLWRDSIFYPSQDPGAV